MENNLQNLFPVPLWKAQIGDEKLNKKLNDAIHDIAKKDTQFDPEKYPFGYTSYISHLPLQNDIRFKEITQKILIECKHYLSAMRIKKTIEDHALGLRVYDLFCNINKQYSFHGPHRHECADLSVVYYVDVNEQSSAFVAHNPAEPLFMHTRLEFFEDDSPLVNDQHEIQPKTGQVLIFPSWLMHEVKQQKTVQERVSIALNLGIIKKNE